MRRSCSVVLTLLAPAGAAQECQWDALASGLNTSVVDMETYNNELYAVGVFSSSGSTTTRGIAVWDGIDWRGMGFGLENSAEVLHVHNDGFGESLFAGGRFRIADGDLANYIAKFNGTEWLPLGGPEPATNGTDFDVHAMATFDDGTGPQLYVGGSFDTAGGNPARRLARWDGKAWFEVGGGLDGPFARVNALCVFDDGTGPALYVGGQQFSVPGDTRTDTIAKWDGTAWSFLGPGIQNSIVQCMVVYDDGSGPALFVGGSFLAEPPGQPGRMISKWDGTSWSDPVPDPSNTVFDMHVGDTGDGPVLYASGSFDNVGGAPTRFLAGWDGSSWQTFDGANDIVWTPHVHDDGSGPALYAGGNFAEIGGVMASRVARFSCSTPCPADVNDDGTASPADFTAWLGCFSNPTSAPFCDRADVNMSGAVDPADFTAWLAAFSAGCP